MWVGVVSGDFFQSLKTLIKHPVCKHMQTSIRPYCFQKCKCQISVLRFIYMTVHSSSDLSGGKINEQNIVFVFYSHVSTVFRHKKK